MSVFFKFSKISTKGIQVLKAFEKFQDITFLTQWCVQLPLGKNDEREKKQTKQSRNKVVYKVRDINREIKDQKKSKSKSLWHLDDTLLSSWEVRTLFLKTNKQT